MLLLQRQLLVFNRLISDFKGCSTDFIFQVKMVAWYGMQGGVL